MNDVTEPREKRPLGSPRQFERLWMVLGQGFVRHKGQQVVKVDDRFGWQKGNKGKPLGPRPHIHMEDIRGQVLEYERPKIQRRLLEDRITLLPRRSCR